MRLQCAYCQQTFESMFGPPHAKCPSCGSSDVRDPDAAFAPAPEAQHPYRASSFAAPPADLRGPESVPSHVLNITPVLVTSVALTLFCQPVGIVGIYLCDRAKHLARQGQLEQAREKLTWALMASVGGWILVVVVTAVVIVAVVLGG